MHLTFDWHGALRRARHGVKEPAAAGGAVPRLAWKRFPYGDRVYRYGGTALHTNWCRLHRADREPYPTVDNLLELLRANPGLEPHAVNPTALAPMLEEAWRSFHAGDFADAVERGLAVGPVGGVVAARAATVYAGHLEEDPARRLAILREAVESAAALVQLAPNWANAWYAHGAALGRYSQQLSVVKALSQGLGGKVRDSLHRALQLEPGHAHAHVGLGVYNAEVIDKVGAMVGGLTYGVRKEAVVDHFEAARALHPQSPVILAEYAQSVLMVLEGAQSGRAHALCAEATACQPVDALERLHQEWALGELEAGPEYP